MRPFDEKWKDHRYHDKVESYNSTIAFLNDSVEEDTYDNNSSDSDDDLSTLSEELLPRCATPQKEATNLYPEFITQSPSSNSETDDCTDTETTQSPSSNSETDPCTDTVIPRSHRLIQKSQLTRIKDKANLYDQLIKTLTRQHYTGNRQSDTMLGFADAHDKYFSPLTPYENFHWNDNS